MHCKLIAWAGLLFAACSAGCCMCDAPYDYCGPTFLAEPGQDCYCDARMNSVFTPYAPYGGNGEYYDGEYVEGDAMHAPQVPTPAGPPDDGSPSDAPTNVPNMQPPAPPTVPIAPQPGTTQTHRSRPVAFRR